MVTVNGIEVNAEGKTYGKYLIENGYNIEKIAVECNGCIVSKLKYDVTIINENDSIEVVSFVGGG